jgi:hypothetical protein
MLPRLESLYEACADGDIYTPGHLHTVRVCKGPHLHHEVLSFSLSLSLGKLTRLESFCEACADGDICTPLHLHTPTSTHWDNCISDYISIPRLESLFLVFKLLQSGDRYFALLMTKVSIQKALNNYELGK